MSNAESISARFRQRWLVLSACQSQIGGYDALMRRLRTRRRGHQTDQLLTATFH